MPDKKGQNIYQEFLDKVRSDHNEGVSSELRSKLHSRFLESAEIKTKEEKKALVFKVVFAAAAVFLIVFAFSLNNTAIEETPGIERRLVYSTTVPQGKPLTVTLSYDASESFKNVEFSIKLEEGVSFHSDIEAVKKLREHSWKGSLEKGVNNIPFVVRTESEGKRKITVTAKYGSFIHLQEVVLDASQQEITVSLYSFDPVPAI
jgi:hypothetical protein